MSITLLSLLSILALLFLTVKFRSRQTNEDIDWEAHNLKIIEKGDDLRVSAGNHIYLNKKIRRELYLQQYREAWNKVRLNFEPITIANETILFTSLEQLSLRQRIVLSWLYVYNVNDRRYKFLFWRMNDSETRNLVLEVAEAKYGSKSQKAVILAAHTLNMSLKKFKDWMKWYDEYCNRR